MSWIQWLDGVCRVAVDTWWWQIKVSFQSTAVTRCRHGIEHRPWAEHCLGAELTQRTQPNPESACRQLGSADLKPVALKVHMFAPALVSLSPLGEPIYAEHSPRVQDRTSSPLCCSFLVMVSNLSTQTSPYQTVTWISAGLARAAVSLSPPPSPPPSPLNALI